MLCCLENVFCGGNKRETKSISAELAILQTRNTSGRLNNDHDHGVITDARGNNIATAVCSKLIILMAMISLVLFK